MELLLEKYRPTEEEDLTQLSLEFANCRLESTDDDPTEWFLKLDRINERLRSIGDDQKYAKQEHEIKIHMMGNLPKEYSEIVTKLSGTLNSLTLNQVEKEIESHWKYKFDGGKSTKSPTSLAMVVGGFGGGKPKGGDDRRRKNPFKKPFKGRCRKCGKHGHKAAECRSPMKGVCFECGEDGHFAKDCPKKTNRDVKTSNPSPGAGMFIGMVQRVPTRVSNASKSFSTTSRWAYATRRIADIEYEAWLLDTGATCHITNDESLMFNTVECDETVVIGDGTIITSTLKGGVTLINSWNERINLYDVLYIPGFERNLISMRQLDKQGGWNLNVNNGRATINKSGIRIRLMTEEGGYSLHCRRTAPPDIKSQYAVRKFHQKHHRAYPAKAVKKIDVKTAHEIYGHPCDEALKKTLKNNGFELTGTRPICEPCAYAKARAKSVSKLTKLKAREAGERLYVDTSGPYAPAISGSQYWFLVVDDYTRKSWSYFGKKKNQLGEKVGNLLDILKGAGIAVKYVRCDNAGENMKQLQAMCETRGITMEYTAPNTPQQNGVVERKFVTIRDRAQALMIGARLSRDYEQLLWAEAVYTATRLTNIVVNTYLKTLSSDELWYGTPPKLFDHLTQWGRIGFVKDQKIIKKLTKKSIKCVMVGYADHHSADTYRMFNMETKKILLSRDIVWAEWHGGLDVRKDLPMFADMEVDLADNQIDDSDWIDADPSQAIIIPPDDDDEDDINEAGRKMQTATIPINAGTSLNIIPADIGETAPPLTNPDNNKQGGGNLSQENNERPKISKVDRELRKLETSYNPVSDLKSAPTSPMESNPEQTKEENSTAQITSPQPHHAFNAALASDPGEPKNYNEALASPDRIKWMKAMDKEVMNFLNRKVWSIVPRTKLRQGQKPIQTRWVFRKKNEHDGSVRYKGRIVVKGYVQIPGVDFTETFSPVATDTSIKVVLANALHNNWNCEMVDIEAAFLEAPLDEDVYIEWPEGVVEFGYIPQEVANVNCIKLTKAMYGCVQSPRAFFRELAKTLRNVGLIQSKADPCLWLKKDEFGKIVFVVVCHVDDLIASGFQNEIDDFKSKIKTRFNLSELGTLTKHLGVWYERKKDKFGTYYELSMDKYQSEILDDFENITGRKAKAANTPGYPGTSLVKNEEAALHLDDYRKLLGKLMWFVKKLSPEASNAIRELASFMDNPGPEHWKSLERLVGYLGKSRIFLKMRKPKNLKVVAAVDSNYAVNKENRRSVTGYIVTIGGCIVSWTSKTQASVTLSSTEAEYVAMSMCATEVKFVQMLIDELAPEQQIKPATIYEDNTGAIFLANNRQVGARTKHIDVREHHIRELIDNGSLEIEHIRTENNPADLCTKNVSETTNAKHAYEIRNGFLLNQFSRGLVADREDVKECSYVHRVVGRTIPSHETVVESNANLGETVEADDWCFL